MVCHFFVGNSMSGGTVPCKATQFMGMFPYIGLKNIEKFGIHWYTIRISNLLVHVMVIGLFFGGFSSSIWFFRWCRCLEVITARVSALRWRRARSSAPFSMSLPQGWSPSDHWKGLWTSTTQMCMLSTGAWQRLVIFQLNLKWFLHVSWLRFWCSVNMCESVVHLGVPKFLQHHIYHGQNLVESYTCILIII